jgi:hypothetical protein
MVRPGDEVSDLDHGPYRGGVTMVMTKKSPICLTKWTVFWAVSNLEKPSMEKLTLS